MRERTLIGRVGVDSGTLWIVDPAGAPQRLTAQDVFDAVNESGDRQGCQVIRDDQMIGASHEGVACRSGDGDGRYPVYAEYRDTKYGKRIARVIVDFTEGD